MPAHQSNSNIHSHADVNVAPSASKPFLLLRQGRTHYNITLRFPPSMASTPIWNPRNTLNAFHNVRSVTHHSSVFSPENSFRYWQLLWTTTVPPTPLHQRHPTRSLVEIMPPCLWRHSSWSVFGLTSIRRTTTPPLPMKFVKVYHTVSFFKFFFIHFYSFFNSILRYIPGVILSTI